MYASNKNYDSLIRQIYSDDIKIYSNLYRSAKEKALSNIKAYQGQVLAAAEVCNLEIWYILAKPLYVLTDFCVL